MTINALLVTFSLNNQFKDYESFFVTLKGTSQQWWHFIPQTFIVATTLNLDELALKLGPHIEPTDSLLIVPVGPDTAGQLPIPAWNWINQVTGSTRRPRAASLSDPALPRGIFSRSPKKLPGT